MKISEKQIISLMEIVGMYLIITDHEPNRNIAEKLLKDIFNQQSDELREVGDE